MEQPIDEAKIAEMLAHFRDSLTAMSLLLKDYQANLDVIQQGQITKTSSICLEAVRQDTHAPHSKCRL